MRADETEQQHEHDDADTDQCELVLGEHPQDDPCRATDTTGFPAAVTSRSRSTGGRTSDRPGFCQQIVPAGRVALDGDHRGTSFARRQLPGRAGHT